MKTVGVILISGWLLSNLCGEMDADSLKFSPPFSNDAYHCRCLPLFDSPLYAQVKSPADAFSLHQKVCEYKTYITSLKRHIDFLTAVCSGRSADIAAWFSEQGRAVDEQVTDTIKKALNKNKRLPPQIQKELSAALAYFQSRDASSVGATVDDQRASTAEQFYQRFVAPKLEKNKKLIPQATRFFNLITVANWLWDKAQDFLSMKNFMAQTTSVLLKNFPVADLEKTMRTATMRQAVHAMADGLSLTELAACWKALSTVSFEDDENAFDTLFAVDMADATLVTGVPADPVEKRIMYAFLFLKDFVDVVTVSMNHVMMTVTGGIATGAKQPTVTQMVDLYTTLNELPIFETISMLDTIATQVAFVVQAMQQGTSSDFTTWLKNNWITIPLVVGVIVVKVVQYYGTASSASTKGDALILALTM